MCAASLEDDCGRVGSADDSVFGTEAAGNAEPVSDRP